MWLPLFALMACAGDRGDTGGGSAVDSDGADTDGGCALLELEVLGPGSPVVGDRWTLWLRCDGATLAGAAVYRSDPVDFASFEDNVATFLVAGEGTLKAQVGSFREEVTVTVGE